MKLAERKAGNSKSRDHEHTQKRVVVLDEEKGEDGREGGIVEKDLGEEAEERTRRGGRPVGRWSPAAILIGGCPDGGSAGVELGGTLAFSLPLPPTLASRPLASCKPAVSRIGACQSFAPYRHITAIHQYTNIASAKNNYTLLPRVTCV